ncbi:hypothetical protein SAMD00019534_045500, partial [Acytostelium subglobosum LB1]|uniref:hypothetical protein n=1 Tax=Acytostelium subglobosum LB1 TaxID=1410327 RepID=UPI0006448A4B
KLQERRRQREERRIREEEEERRQEEERKRKEDERNDRKLQRERERKDREDKQRLEMEMCLKKAEDERQARREERERKKKEDERRLAEEEEKRRKEREDRERRKKDEDEERRRKQREIEEERKRLMVQRELEHSSQSINSKTATTPKKPTPKQMIEKILQGCSKSNNQLTATGNEPVINVLFTDELREEVMDLVQCGFKPLCEYLSLPESIQTMMQVVVDVPLCTQVYAARQSLIQGTASPELKNAYARLSTSFEIVKGAIITVPRIICEPSNYSILDTLFGVIDYQELPTANIQSFVDLITSLLGKKKELLQYVSERRDTVLQSLMQHIASSNIIDLLLKMIDVEMQTVGNTTTSFLNVFSSSTPASGAAAASKDKPSWTNHLTPYLILKLNEIFSVERSGDLLENMAPIIGMLFKPIIVLNDGREMTTIEAVNDIMSMPGGYSEPYGMIRLKCLSVIQAMVKVNVPKLDQAIWESGIMKKCVNIFFEYESNNIAHSAIESLITPLIQRSLGSDDEEFMYHLLKDCGFVKRTVEVLLASTPSIPVAAPVPVQEKKESPGTSSNKSVRFAADGADVVEDNFSLQKKPSTKIRRRVSFAGGESEEDKLPKRENSLENLFKRPTSTTASEQQDDKKKNGLTKPNSLSVEICGADTEVVLSKLSIHDSSNRLVNGTNNNTKQHCNTSNGSSSSKQGPQQQKKVYQNIGHILSLCIEVTHIVNKSKNQFLRDIVDECCGDGDSWDQVVVPRLKKEISYRNNKPVGTVSMRKSKGKPVLFETEDIQPMTESGVPIAPTETSSKFFF